MLEQNPEMTWYNQRQAASSAIFVLEVHPVTNRLPTAGFSPVQNIGRGSRAPVCVRGRRPPPATRFPGDLSQGHAPQPHEKTTAATGVLHDRPESTVCCRCQKEAPRPLRRMAACLFRADPTTGPSKPQNNHRNRFVRCESAATEAPVRGRCQLPQRMEADAAGCGLRVTNCGS